MEITIEGDDTIALYNASAGGWTTTLNRLIQKDPHILKKISLTTFSETPLHISALLGHLEFTKTLLLHNSQLAAELDSQKRCPLHLASAEGHVEIVEELLQANKDACLILDQDGRIPLHYAAMRGRVDVVRKLILARPDSTRVMLGGKETVLHLCVEYNQLEPLKLLVDSTGDDEDFLNSKTSEGGNTILHLAVMLKQIETVKYLLLVTKVKKEVDSRNNNDFTALKMLENCPKDFNSFTIRNMLLDASARDERVNNSSESAKPTQSRKKWWKNLLKYLKYQSNWVEDNRGYIMVVATVITTLTFQQAASPPGGVWPESGIVTLYGNNITMDAGTSVIGSIDPLSYFYFIIYNVISFMASVIVTFLLISGFPVKNKICMGLLTIALCTTLAFLVFTYLIAVSMVTPNSLYDLRYKELFSTQIRVLYSLVAVISLVFLFHLIHFLVWLGRRIKKSIPAWVEAICELNC